MRLEEIDEDGKIIGAKLRAVENSCNVATIS